MNTAAGFTAPLLVHVEDNELDSEVVHFFPIPHMTAHGKGVLAVTKTRAGNAAFFRKFIAHIVDFLKPFRQEWAAATDTSEDSFASVVPSDGETAQLNALLLGKELEAQLNARGYRAHIMMIMCSLFA